LLLQAFDIGFLLEEKAGDAGDDAGLVAADDGDGGEFFLAANQGIVAVKRGIVKEFP
jgi:hypothetical protein